MKAADLAALMVRHGWVGHRAAAELGCSVRRLRKLLRAEGLEQQWDERRVAAHTLRCAEARAERLRAKEAVADRRAAAPVELAALRAELVHRLADLRYSELRQIEDEMDQLERVAKGRP